jgi:hypothetical protein
MPAQGSVVHKTLVLASPNLLSVDGECSVLGSGIQRPIEGRRLQSSASECSALVSLLNRDDGRATGSTVDLPRLPFGVRSVGRCVRTLRLEHGIQPESIGRWCRVADRYEGVVDTFV